MTPTTPLVSWIGSIWHRDDIASRATALTLRNGVASAGEPALPQGVIGYSGESAVWERVLAAVLPRFHNDLLANVTQGMGLEPSGDPLVGAQYYAAVMRAVELLRPFDAMGRPIQGDRRSGSRAFDAPIGRYVRLDLGGHEHRLYFEEAGQGIPLLLQHTAGCHGSQWRHLFEVPGITERFRAVIAVEGALKVGGDLDHLQELWHPQVSNEFKARAMEGLGHFPMSENPDLFLEHLCPVLDRIASGT